VKGLEVGSEVVYALGVEKLVVNFGGPARDDVLTLRMTYDGWRCPSVWVN
jgi:hypothetical protein